MFTDVEIGLAMKHRADLRAVTGHAQSIIDGQHAEVVALQRQLAAERGKNAALIIERGRRHNDLIARRIAARN